VRSALASLPWVEPKTITADRATKNVHFGVNDKSKFSEAAVKRALPARYRTGLTVVSAPE
jgi:hypothetical protein